MSLCQLYIEPNTVSDAGKIAELANRDLQSVFEINTNKEADIMYASSDTISTIVIKPSLLLSLFIWSTFADFLLSALKIKKSLTNTKFS